MANPNPILPNGPGNPGNKGGGRPKDEWKRLCQELASKPEQLEVAREVLADKGHPAWLGAWRFVAEQGYGKPETAVDITSNGETIGKALIGVDVDKDI